VVNVADRPYRDFLCEAMKTNHTIYDLILGRRRPFAFDDPRFAAKRAGAAKSIGISRMVNKFVLDGSPPRPWCCPTSMAKAIRSKPPSRL
jgi:hypothetical protein